MKTLLFIIAHLILANSCKAQDAFQVKLDSLNKIKREYQNNLNEINSEIDNIVLQRNKNSLKDKAKKDIIAKNFAEADLRRTAEPFGEVILEVPTNSKLVILDYEGHYFKVLYNNKIGYISSTWIKNPDSIFELLKIKNEKTNSDIPVTKEAYQTKYSNDNLENKSAANDTIGTHRCKALTQAGTQCKRNAEPGCDYCWQHKDKQSVSSTEEDRTIYTGPRGGQYYINSSGKKTYIRKKK